ncbi:MAG: hypothetical protein L0Z62_11585 [Gemmataceae bacterium]|nr:hypothetical protein [Gemmataceae bacterium]
MVLPWFANSRAHQQRRYGPSRHHFLPQLEALETRTVLSTLTVTSPLDDGAPATLRALLARANPGDTIRFAPQLDGQTLRLTQGELVITKRLDIEGPGPSQLTISGNHASRVFNILGGKVNIARLTITAGLADKNAPLFPSTGGGILNQGDLTLSDVVLSYNQAVGDPSASVVLSGFGLNVAVTGGAFGGATYNSGTLSVIDSTFTGNLALGGDGSSGSFVPGFGAGGGIGNSGLVTVSGSTFDGNQAVGGSRCTGPISGNYHVGLGFAGGIYNNTTGSATITRSTFHRNQAIGGSFNSGNNPGSGAAGAIGSPGPAAVRDSTFSYNLAQGGNHNLANNDIVYFLPNLFSGDGNAGAILSISSLDVSGSTFTHNLALGGNDNHGNPGVLYVGTGLAGAINAFSGQATIRDSTLAFNQAIGGAGSPGREGGKGIGSAIVGANFYDGPQNVTVTNLTLHHNRAIDWPEGLANSGGAAGVGRVFQPVPGALLVTSAADDGSPGTLRSVLASASPGATIMFAPQLDGQTIRLTQGQLEISKRLDIQGPGPYRLAISGNLASRVFAIQKDAKVTMAGLTITHGLADKNAPNFPSAGGGILNQGDLTLSDVVLSDNQAISDASASLQGRAGAAIGGGILNLGTITVSDSTFIRNAARGADSLTMLSTPEWPVSGGFGGAIFNLGGVAAISNSAFHHNQAIGGSEVLIASPLTSATIVNNTGTGGAGAIYNNQGTATVTGSTFSHNQAIGGSRIQAGALVGLAFGGGIGSGGSPSATLTVSASTFFHNQAVGGNDNQAIFPFGPFGPGNALGGGINVFNGMSTITGSTLVYNQAIAGRGRGGSKGGLAAGSAVLINNVPLGNVNSSVTGATIRDVTLANNETLDDLTADNGPGASTGQDNAITGILGATVNIIASSAPALPVLVPDLSLPPSSLVPPSLVVPALLATPPPTLASTPTSGTSAAPTAPLQGGSAPEDETPSSHFDSVFADSFGMQRLSHREGFTRPVASDRADFQGEAADSPRPRAALLPILPGADWAFLATLLPDRLDDGQTALTFGDDPAGVQHFLQALDAALLGGVPGGPPVVENRLPDNSPNPPGEGAGKKMSFLAVGNAVGTYLILVAVARQWLLPAAQNVATARAPGSRK